MSEPFHQFPLAILGYGKTPLEKIHAIIAHATISAGKKKEAELGYTEAVKWCQFAAKGRSWSGFDVSCEAHRAWALGKDVVHISWHNSPKFCLETHDLVCSYLSSQPRSPFVRVNAGLTGEVALGQFPFLDFAVLCAVYAIIGSKPYARVHRNRVRAGALGYSSGSALFDAGGNITPEGRALLNRRQDGAQPLSTRQVRTILTRLEVRGFYSRVPLPNRRSTIYSRSLSHDQLADTFIKSMSNKQYYKSAAYQAQKAAGAKIRDYWKEAKKERASLIKVVAGDGRGDDHLNRATTDRPLTDH